MSERSVIQTTLFLCKPPRGNLNVLSPFLTDNCFFLNQRKRKNGRRNIYHDKTITKEGARFGGRFRYRLLPKRHRYGPSYRTRLSVDASNKCDADCGDGCFLQLVQTMYMYDDDAYDNNDNGVHFWFHFML